MTLQWFIIAAALLALVSWRMVAAYRRRRYGFAIALTFVAAMIVFEMGMRWYESGRKAALREHIEPAAPSGMGQMEMHAAPEEAEQGDDSPD